MTDPQSEPDAGSPLEVSSGRRLDSWKEIAAYLKRDVATVRRWEKREALPVQRHLHEKLGSVFAYTAELDSWSESRRQKTVAGSEESADVPVSVSIPFRQRVLPWLIAGTSALGLVMVLLYWAPWRSQGLRPPLRLTVELGAGVPLAQASVQFGEAAVLSPDGSVVAFVGDNGAGERQLYLRRLDRFDATPLSGTDGALSPFFSPNGRWIGFFAGGKLKKVAVAGGAPVTLADIQSARGGAWGEDDAIVFSPHQIAGTHLVRVPSAGGTPEPLTTLAEGEVIHLFPQVLPGGKAVLYTSGGVIGAYNNGSLVVQSLSGGERKVVYTGGYYARYLTSGHLVFIHDGTLFAAPFDLDRLAITGQPAPAIEGVASNSQTGAAQFSAAANGTIVYLPGQDAGAGTSLRWMDQAGKATALLPAAGNWINPRFSPDGERLALEMRDEASHISVYDRGRNTLTPLASDTGTDQRPVWAPDGRWLAFAGSSGGTTANVYAQRVDGIGKPVRMTESPRLQQPSSWHPSGKFIAFEETNPHTGRDVMILPIEGDSVSGWRAGTATAFVNGPGSEFDPMFSPDGRWLAYVADESGNAVYVQPFPGPGGRWLVGAGVNPTWSRPKSELFYGVNGQIMVTTYAVDGLSFHAEKARLWSEARYQTRGIRRMFDLHPDGERFALAPAVQASNGSSPDTITMILNFSDELRRLTTTP